MIDFLLILGIAFLYECCDAALGQGYGTLGTPTLILLGYDPKIIVPAILISQASGGLIGAIRHHHHGNADFTHMKTEDFKKVLIIVGFGISGVIAASIIGFKLSKDIMSTYIGVMVLVIGLIVLSGFALKYSQKKLAVIGLVSAFNKGLSGFHHL